MIDFILGVYLAGLAVRGWMRGLVKEVIDLVGLVLGSAIAFRLSGPVGDFLTDRFGVTSEWARIGAGVVLFVGVGVGLALGGRVLSQAMKLPGLNLLNRVGGALVAAAWGALLLAVVVTVIRALPFQGLGEQVEDSKVASIVAGPESIPVRLISSLGGAQVASAIALLEEVTGGRRLVVEADERIELEPVAANRLSPSPDAANEMYLMLNRTRLTDGVDPLAWSPGLAEVALLHANEMYTEGYLGHLSPSTGLVADRVESARLRLAVLGETISLASTTRANHSSLVESEPNLTTMTSRSFDRVGVAVVQGPFGLLTVQVFGG